MSHRFEQVSPPRGLLKLLWRTPILLYHLRLGWLLGNRFLLLCHTGRITGKKRAAVLEVVKLDKERGVYYVASGFGSTSNWYQNILRRPDVFIQVGAKRIAARAHPLTPEESAALLLDYAKRHPILVRLFLYITGYRVRGTEDDYRELGREHIPFVAFEPDNF